MQTKDYFWFWPQEINILRICLKISAFNYNYVIEQNTVSIDVLFKYIAKALI